MEELKEIAPAEFLENFVFPVLLPGLEATLRTAKHTERRKRFNPLDYLSAYLFRNNPNKSNLADVAFEDIPCVKAEWTSKPRPQLPLSATLTEAEAATIIQAHYRGHRVRSSNAHVVEFRKWQKRYAAEKIGVRIIQQWWRARNLPRRSKTSHVTSQEETINEGGEGGEGGMEGWMREEQEEEEDGELSQQGTHIN